MEYILIPYNWKDFFIGVVLSASNLSLRTDSFQVERKTREDDRLDPFGENPDEEAHRDDFTVAQKVHFHSNWKRNQDAVCWVK